MRLTITILIMFFLSLPASGIAQTTVTFSGKNLPLEAVFSAIKKQTGYIVLWNTNLQKTARRIATLDARNMSLPDFLNLVLKDQPFDYKLGERTIVLTKKKR